MECTRTQVETPHLPYPLHEGAGCVLLGSCFSQYMGERMADSGMPVMYNPLGTLFNPSSIALLLKAMEDGTLVEGSAFYADVDNEWRSWLADTKLKAATREECISMVSKRLNALADSLSQATYLFVTLGTCVAYRLANGGQVVTNCHRQPDRTFREVWLSQEECEAALQEIVLQAQALNENIHVVFTVSPYRYKKYTLHGSQLAKARLLLAVDAVCRQWPARCTYFPAYEIVLDELRDYRYFATDMLHPAPEAADYVWERLKAASNRKQQIANS